MKVLDVRWFSGGHVVGIVRVDVPYEGIKYYIGSGHGDDEQVDIDYISAFGATFPSDVGDILFGVKNETMDTERQP